jgi:hypothetical protein
MPQAPCNDFCQGSCHPAKGCALNILNPCSDECIEPPPGAPATATLTDGTPAADTAPADSPAIALLRLIIHDPGFDKVRRELGKAIRQRGVLSNEDGDHPSDKA